MRPSSAVAVNTQRSAFLTHRPPAESRRSFWWVTTRSPTPAVWPSATVTPFLGHRASRDALEAGTAVQLRDGRGVGGDHEAGAAGIDVGLPGPVDGVEERFPIATGDTPVPVVRIDGIGPPEAEEEGGGLFPVVRSA